MDRIPRPGDIYRHFTNELYQVVTTAMHAETGEQLVIYQAMFGDFSVFARPAAQFLGETDRSKYPQASQQYLFEKMEKTKCLEGRMRNVQECGADIQNGRSRDALHAAALQRETDQVGRMPQGRQNAMDAAAYRLTKDKMGQMPQGRQDAADAAVHEQRPDSGASQSGEISGRLSRDMQGAAGASVSSAREPRPRTQSPAESRRGLRQDPSEATGADAYYYERRRRQIEEREQRRGLFRRPERHESATEELRANPCLLKFLEADTYEEKFQVLNEIQDDITDRLIDDIAVVLDVVIPEGELNDRFRQLKNIILTRQKYEIKRLRF